MRSSADTVDFEFRADATEDPRAQFRVDDEVGVARGDRDVGLGQHHLHVRQHAREERPVAMHLLQQPQALVAVRPEPCIHGRAEAVPARQHQAALRPGEHPGDRTQRLDRARLVARGRAAADVEFGDLADHRRLPEVVLEARCFVDQMPIGLERAVRKRFERLQVLRLRRAACSPQQRRFHRRGRQDLEVAAAHLGVRVLGADHLALFGDADLALHGAAGLRQDRLVRRPAAATHRATAAVEQAHADVVPAEGLDQFDLRLEQLPARRQVAAVLVAVRVAEHHFLRVVARGEQARVCRDRRAARPLRPRHCAGRRSSRTAGSRCTAGVRRPRGRGPLRAAAARPRARRTRRRTSRSRNWGCTARRSAAASAAAVRRIASSPRVSARTRRTASCSRRGVASSSTSTRMRSASSSAA